MIKYIDIHCHLDSADYGEEIGGVLERMKENEIGAITIGTDLESSRRAIKIAQENENVWACIGVHPVDNSPRPPLTIRGGERSEEVGFNESEFEKLVQNPKVVGIGECGLDFFRVDPVDLENNKIRQEKLFKEQIEFALKHDKPLMLHCRAAYDETLEILKEYKEKYGEKLRGNCHFFAGSVEQAKRFVSLGFACSFTGVITFPPAHEGRAGTHDYDEVIKSLPDDKIMAETDAPFVAPVPYRGKRNEPAYVVEVYKRIAEIRGESLDNMAEILVNNAINMFGIRS